MRADDARFHDPDSRLLKQAAEILDANAEDRYEKADELLDRARIASHVLFRSWQYEYALLRARLADRRGERDEAAAFAFGAIWRVAEDELGPSLSRHPDIGRVGRDDEVVDELERYVREGDAEAYDPVVEEYRSISDGAVLWHWSLVKRLRPNPRIVGPRESAVEESRREVAPLLAELRHAGFHAYDLEDFSRQKLPSKRAAAILVSWLPRIKKPLSLKRIANALCDAKARSVAAQPMLDLFETLPDDPPAEKDRVAATAGTLARDPQFEQVARLLRDPRHRRFSGYLLWGVSYMKDPRAVDLCLELLDDEELGNSAVATLGDLRSERARSSLEAIAMEPTTRKRNREAEQQRDRVSFAKKGLAKLEKATAAGRARPQRELGCPLSAGLQRLRGG